MESWSNTVNKYDAYVHWIEYSQLENVQAMRSLHHGCTHMAECLELTTNEMTCVILKKIFDRQKDQLFDFHQVNCCAIHKSMLCVFNINHHCSDCIFYSNS